MAITAAAKLTAMKYHAALRAQAERALAARHRRKIETQRTQRARNIMLAFAACGVIVVGTSGLYVAGWVPLSLRLGGSGRVEPTDRFLATYVGQILFTPEFGDRCRQILFSNKTGTFGNDRFVSCYEALALDTNTQTENTIPGARAQSIPGARLNSIRDAFATK